NEVYALTAFLLYKNGVIPEDQVVDAQSLQQIKMPNRDGYVLPDWKHGMPRPFPNKPQPYLRKLARLTAAAKSCNARQNLGSSSGLKLSAEAVTAHKITVAKKDSRDSATHGIGMGHVPHHPVGVI